MSAPADDIVYLRGPYSQNEAEEGSDDAREMYGRGARDESRVVSASEYRRAEMRDRWTREVRSTLHDGSISRTRTENSILLKKSCCPEYWGKYKVGWEGHEMCSDLRIKLPE